MTQMNTQECFCRIYPFENNNSKLLQLSRKTSQKVLHPFNSPYSITPSQQLTMDTIYSQFLNSDQIRSNGIKYPLPYKGFEKEDKQISLNKNQKKQSKTNNQFNSRLQSSRKKTNVSSNSMNDFQQSHQFYDSPRESMINNYENKSISISSIEIIQSEIDRDEIKGSEHQHIKYKEKPKRLKLKNVLPDKKQSRKQIEEENFNESDITQNEKMIEEDENDEEKQLKTPKHQSKEIEVKQKIDHSENTMRRIRTRKQKQQESLTMEMESTNGIKPTETIEIIKTIDLSQQQDKYKINETQLMEEENRNEVKTETIMAENQTHSSQTTIEIETDNHQPGWWLRTHRKTKIEKNRENEKIMSERMCIPIEMIRCFNIVNELQNNENSEGFKVEVDPIALNILDYYTVIKHPMDLQTIQNKIVKNVYKTPEDFKKDMHLMFENARKYNPPQYFIHQSSILLEQEFEKLYNRRFVQNVPGEVYLYTPEETMPTFLPIAIKATYTVNENYLNENGNIRYYDDASEIEVMKEQVSKMRNKSMTRKKMTIQEKQTLVNEISKMSSERIIQLLDEFHIPKKPGDIIHINLNEYNDNELRIIQNIVNGTYGCDIRLKYPQNKK